MVNAEVASFTSATAVRLESRYSSNTTKFNYLFGFVQAEVETKTAKSSSSCSNALLWLTRAMDFLVELFRNLHDHEDWTMAQACTDSYGKTLKKWHGWLASSSFTIAMKLVPDRKKFIEVIGGTGDIHADIKKFCTIFSPILKEIHKFLFLTFGVKENIFHVTISKRDDTMFVQPSYIGLVGELDVNLLLRKTGSPWHVNNHLFFLSYRLICQSNCQYCIGDNEKEEEIEIGFPTDVKHVAHIGMDGPSANTPSWMNEYKGNAETKDTPSKSSTQDPLTLDVTGIQESSGAQLDSPTRHSSSKPRRHKNSSSSLGSPTQDSSGSSTKPRRHKNHSMDLDSNRDPSHRSRRSHNLDIGSDSPSQELPGLPKHSRRKKSKESSGSGSSRSSRSKGPDTLTQNYSYSDPGSGHELKNNEKCPNSALKVYEDGNECDEISRGIRAL
ncbi:hypothetical protein ACSBR2_030901 [Camellia fascicularis]